MSDQDNNLNDLDLNKYEYDEIAGINVDEIADNSFLKDEPLLSDFDKSGAQDILFNPDFGQQPVDTVMADIPTFSEFEIDAAESEETSWQSIALDDLYFSLDDDIKKNKRKENKKKKNKQKEQQELQEVTDFSQFLDDKDKSKETAPMEKPEKKEDKFTVSDHKYAINSDIFDQIKAKQNFTVSLKNTSPADTKISVSAKSDNSQITEKSKIAEPSVSNQAEKETIVTPPPVFNAVHNEKSSDFPETEKSDSYEISKTSNPQIMEEYTSDGEREDVLPDLKSTLIKIIVKSIWLMLLLLWSAYLTIGKISYFQFLLPNIIDPIHSPKYYCLATLILTSFVFILNISPLIAGLKRIFSAKISADGMLFFLGSSCIALDIYYFLNIGEFSKYMLNFDFLFVFGVLFNLLAKKKMIRNVYDNFKMISKDQMKTVICGPKNLPINNDIMMETGNGGDVVYLEKTKIVSNYLRHSFEELEQPKAVQTLYFLIVILSFLASGTLFATHRIDLATMLLLLNSAFALSTPIFSSRSYVSALCRVSQMLRKVKSFISGITSAKTLSDTGILVITDDDLVSGNDIKLVAMQLRNGYDPSELLTKTSALFQTAGKAIGNLFLNVLDHSSAIEMPKVENVLCYDRLGYSALIDGKKFSVGNAEFMKRLSIDLKDETSLDNNNYIYVSSEGVLIGIFIVKYELSSVTRNAISILDRLGYSLAVVATDFNINENLFANQEIKHPDMITILSYSTAKECKKLCTVRNTAPAEIASFDGVRGIAFGISGSNSLLICRALQNAFSLTASIFGFAVALILSIVLKNFSFWLPFVAVAYQILWGIPSFVISRCCKF